MDPEPKVDKKKIKTYSKAWNQFIDKAMPVLVQNPTQARFTLKFVPRRNQFILKVTDGGRIVMKRCHASEQYEQIQKFTRLATRALTNEGEVEKHEEQKGAGKDKTKKKKKK